MQRFFSSILWPLSVCLLSLSPSHSLILHSHLASVTNHSQNGTDHQPKCKKRISRKCVPPPKTSANGNFAKFAHLWENLVFFAPTQNVKKNSLFQKSRKIVQDCVSPILTRHPSRHECTPSRIKICHFLRLLRHPPRILVMSPKAKKQSVILNRSPTTHFQKQHCQKSETPQFGQNGKNKYIYIYIYAGELVLVPRFGLSRVRNSTPSRVRNSTTS